MTPVPKDVAAQILELSEDGLGRNKISQITGINSDTVRRVITGEHQSFSDQFSTRQLNAFINGWPVERT